MLKFAKSFSDAWPIAAGIFALGVMAQPVAAMTAPKMPALTNFGRVVAQMAARAWS